GLYLMAFSLGLSGWLVLLGGALVVAAAALAYPLFWRDVLRLKLFWVSLGLSLYLVVRAWVGGGPAALVEEPLWGRLLAVTGLASLPLAWWLAQCRLHWHWLIGTVLAGGGVAFTLSANWSSLEHGRFSNPWAWGEPAQMGFMASTGLVVLLAVLLVGLQRLGTGWRPAAQVMLAMLLAVPSVIILMGTGYTTAWLAAGSGVTLYVLATPVLGKHQGHRLGRLGLTALLAVLVLGVVSHEWLLPHSLPLVQRLVEPLQAFGLMLNGETEQARALHAGMVDRLALWQQAWQVFREHWLVGTGQLMPAEGARPLARYGGYYSLLASTATATGAVGLLGFVTVAVLPLRALLWANLRRHWHAVWGLGILSCFVTVMVLCLFSMPLRFVGPTGIIVLLTAAMQMAVFHRDWLNRRSGSGP
ncbi:MAG: hypothetical protein RI841_14725, partial [Halomonas sp.]|uniref:O-antigen ligase family protein n=1 Tax=Halomonas sp. TaxID=1486246 RepID=UPI0028705AB3